MQYNYCDANTPTVAETTWGRDIPTVEVEMQDHATTSRDRICRTCSKPFTVTQIRPGRGLYCSKRCVGRIKNDLTCGHCGATFSRRPSVQKRYGVPVSFCSKTCSSRGRKKAHLDDVFWRRVAIVDDATSCWEFNRPPSLIRYGRITVDGRSMGAHRAAWEVSFGPIPDGLFVLHRCDNPPCVRPEHLFLGTAEDNARDRANKGRTARQPGDRHGLRKHPECVARGESHGGSRLTEEQVRQIRLRQAQGGTTHEKLASEFGVSRTTVTLICLRKTWRHIEDQADQTAVTSRSFRDWSAAE